MRDYDDNTGDTSSVEEGMRRIEQDLTDLAAITDTRYTERVYADAVEAASQGLGS